MTSPRAATLAGETGLTVLVAGIVAHLPNKTVRAPSATWHWAFMRLRDNYSSALPELSALEFATRPGVWPVSERLEKILMVIDMAGAGSTLNPTLVVRQFGRAQKSRLKKRLADRLKNRQQLIEELGKKLQGLLDNAPSTAST